ncbi:MAG: PilZ domain-containing protein [Candidatus Omnitrophica bacterium]|nr:PilZ domain-containing protein [Candidatus Omnitrophota bacterium]
MKQDYSGPERRENKRVDVSFIIAYRVNKAPTIFMLVGGKEVYALMMDLSEGGMALLTEYEIPVGTELSIKFTLINFEVEKEHRTRVMKITGKVKYCGPSEKEENRLGISFTQIKKEDKAAIANFVKTIKA